jgi:hypothetical protein
MSKPMHEYHVVVTENHTFNGVPEHHHFSLDVTSNEVVDDHMIQHLVNFAREAVNHDGHPKKYFATSPSKKDVTPTYVPPCFK